MTPLAEARASLLDASLPLTTRETLPVEDALGRITAELVRARESVPHYHGAAMDGIALRAADTAGAGDAHPVDFALGSPDRVARPFSYVDTGNALPAWADAVVMIERVFAGAAANDAAAHAGHAHAGHAHAGDGPGVGRADASPDDDCCAPTDDPTAATAAPDASSLEDNAARLVHVRAAATPWQHVRLVGEDVVASELLLARGHEIRPYDVAALLAAGIVEVAVRPRPLVAILPTGDELIEPGEARRPGRIVEFNSRMVAAFVREWGGEPLRLAPVGDNLDAIRSRVALALREADVVCVIAGSSAGEHDFTAQALASVGELRAHGIAVMPGKPAIVAAVHVPPDDGAAAPRARVALGIPGYPVSAAVICRELLEPLLAHLLGKASLARPTVRATTPRPIASRLGHEELVRVMLGTVGERMIVTPLGRGAGAITTMARADGVVRLAPGVELIEAGAEVDVELLRPLAAVRDNVLLAGSLDPVLGLLEDALRSAVPGGKLALSSVGSEAGLRALARGETNVAAIVVDRTGAAAAVAAPGAASSAATSELLRTLVEQGALLVHLVARDVGLIVAPGNPLGLGSIADLQRGDVRTPPEIKRSTVDQPEPTPMALAVAVKSRLADAALGLASAAASLGLGFVAVAREDYALVLRADFVASARGQALLAAVRSDAFRAAVATLPGYDATRIGAVQPLRLGLVSAPAVGLAPGV